MKSYVSESGRENKLTDYTILSDEELVALIREKENDSSGEADGVMSFLLNKYKPLVTKKTNGLYLIGAEHEDLIQEGMIGLFKSIRDYSPGKECSFFHFADTCISRQVYTAITQSNRQKHSPLNNSLSLSQEQGEEGGTLEEMLESLNVDNPEKQIIEQEFFKGLFEKLNGKLSRMEQQVLPLYLDGFVYTDIAAKLGKEPKTIDNAIQRIRKKIGNLKVGE